MTDEEQIRQLIARVWRADAEKDPEAFAAGFAPDGAYHSNRGVSRGREALRKNLADRIAVNPPDRETIHLCGEGTIEVAGDRGTAVTPYIGYGRIGNSPWGIMTIGHFHSVLTRLDGQWYFEEIENRQMGPSGWPATVLHHPTV